MKLKSLLDIRTPRPLMSIIGIVMLNACVVAYTRVDDPRSLPSGRVLPSVSVLLRDSLSLIAGKRVGLMTNSAGVDEKGRSTISLLRQDPRARSANVYLTVLFSPEHGLQANEDRTNLPSGIDPATSLPVYSLYGAQTLAPPDSVLQTIDALIIDLPDVGSRTWTYVGAMVYAMRAAAAQNKTVIVLDKPNPLTGAVVEGPMLDSSLAYAGNPSAERGGQAYALYPIPLRHGMTIGELARFYNAELKIGANLKVVKMAGWTRELWFDRTDLPFVPPSPNLPTFQSVQLYPALVAFESSNLSVGRGTDAPFQRVGAPWLDPKKVISVLKDQRVMGVRFTAEKFRPRNATDGKYENTQIPGIRITVTNRTNLQTSRVTAVLLAAIHEVHGERLELDARGFDLRFGSTAAREAILSGTNPDVVIDREFGPAYAFRERVKRYLLY